MIMWIRTLVPDDEPIKNFFFHPEKYTEPVEGGESFDELFKRTSEFLKEKVDPLLAEGKDVLIVGHGALNSGIISLVRNLPIEKFWSEGIENCKLKKLK